MNLIQTVEILTAIIIVRCSGNVAYEEQQFVIEPENRTAVFGSKIILPCKVTHKTGILQWTKDDFGLGNTRNLPGYDRYRMIGDDKSGNYSLEIFPVTLEDEGKYQCQVGFGAQGQNPLRSRFAWLSVIIPTKPPVILQGSVVDAPEYDLVTLDCVSLAGRPPAKLIWMDHLGNAIIENVSFKIKHLPNDEGSTLTLTLKMIVSRYHNNMVLTCQTLDNEEKPKSAQVTLNVIYAPKVSITVKSGADSSGRILQGARISLIRQVYSNLPGPEQKWFVGTQLVFGRNNESTTGHALTKISKAEVQCKAVGEAHDPMTSFTSEGPMFHWNLENVETNVKNNVTLVCSVEGNPLPKVVWIHGSTRKVVSSTNTLILAINRDNFGLYFCKVVLKRLAAGLRSNHPYLISGPTQVGNLNTIGRVECSIAPVDSTSQVFVTFHNIDINGTTEKYSTLEEHEPNHSKSFSLVREFRPVGIKVYNWTDTDFHGFSKNFVNALMKTKKSFPLFLMILGVVLIFLVPTSVGLILLHSRRNFQKTFSNPGTNHLCLSDGSKGSNCKLELVTETEDQSQSESEFTNAKNGFFSQIADVVPTSVMSTEIFRSTDGNSGIEPMDKSKDRTGGTFARMNRSSEIKINENYVSYIGYAKDYNPPIQKKVEPDIQINNSFVMQKFPVAQCIDPIHPQIAGADYKINPYLSALDRLLPENLNTTAGNDRLPCTIPWQNDDFGQRAHNLESPNSSVCSIPEEMTLL